MKLNGIMSAVVTPLNADSTLNLKQFEKIIEFQIENKVHSLLIIGGTGENIQLTFDEKIKTVKAAIEIVKGRVPVIAGVIEPGIGEAIKLGKLLKQLEPDALLVSTPYYETPTDEGIYKFFKKFDEEVDKEFLIYNIPSRTHVNASPGIVERLVEDVPNLIGIKECTQFFTQHMELINRLKDKISIFTGSDTMGPIGVLYGASGIMVGSACVLPDIWVHMYDAAVNRDIDKIVELQKKYVPLINLLYKEANPAPIKYALSKMGMYCGIPSLPLLEASYALKEELDAELEKLGII